MLAFFYAAAADGDLVEFDGAGFVVDPGCGEVLVFPGRTNPCISGITGKIGVFVPGLVGGPGGVGAEAHSAGIVGVAFEPLEADDAEDQDD